MKSRGDLSVMSIMMLLLMMLLYDDDAAELKTKNGVVKKSTKEKPIQRQPVQYTTSQM